MGVPGLFRWLSEKCPDIIEEGPNNDEFDNLYLDMNDIIHSCCSPVNKPALATEEVMMIEIMKYIERIIAMIRPRKVLYLAIDGVAPRAKMNQQRSHQGLEIKKSFDSNCITPGTLFMAHLAERLRCWIADKLKEWKNLKVILSDASVPGEGEHKIIDFIRAHDPNTRHVIYGKDADLILLSLATHEPSLKVLREKNFYQEGIRNCFTCGQLDHMAYQCTGHPKYIFLNIQILRENLDKKLQIPWNKINVIDAIDDWVFLCFFIGNDFLPCLPSLETREDAIDILIDIWKDCYRLKGGYLTDNGNVNLERLQYIITELGKEDDDVFQRYKNDESITITKDNDVDVDSIRLWKAEFKERYKQKFGDKLSDKEFQEGPVKSYIIGLSWVLRYYYQGVPSWKWYYPYHYSPFASDFNNIGDIKIDEFEPGEPFEPFEQLMCVLPPQSKEHLPIPYQKLMTNEDSEIKDFYPKEFEIDLNGKRSVWQGVAILPFIDESRLLKAIKLVNPQLTTNEIKRNNCGIEIVFDPNKNHHLEKSIS